MASTYFSMIIEKLKLLLLNAKPLMLDTNNLEHYQKLFRNQIDAEILENFCYSLETEEDYSTGGKAAQIITHLNKIWVEEDEEENKLETWPQHIQDLDLLTFGLQRKVQQSKTLIQQCCPFFLQHSSMMQSQILKCNSTTIHKVLYHSLRYSVFKYPIPIENPIQILSVKLSFLDGLSNRVDGCIDSKELVEYTNFVHAFSKNATFLIGMYWANEEANAAEMNTVLLDTLHNIKPYAAHVTASYFALLNSNNLIKEEEHFLQSLYHYMFSIFIDLA